MAENVGSAKHLYLKDRFDSSGYSLMETKPTYNLSQKYMTYIYQYINKIISVILIALFITNLCIIMLTLIYI